MFSNLDILEERIRERGHIRTINVGGQTQKWAYRSEVSGLSVFLFLLKFHRLFDFQLVGKHGLDDNHKNIWAAYGFIIIFGFGAFVYVKSQVVMHRKEEMEEREKIRRSLNLLSSSDRKKVTIVTE